MKLPRRPPRAVRKCRFEHSHAAPPGPTLRTPTTPPANTLTAHNLQERSSSKQLSRCRLRWVGNPTRPG
eukprot:8433500-Alexandrium_andersonii.AAC.1